MIARNRTLSRLAFVLPTALSAATVVISLAACGGADVQPPAAPPAPPPTTASEIAPSAPPAAASPVASAPASATPGPAPAPTSALTTTKTDPAWASCHQRYQGAGRDFIKTAKNKDVSKEVAAMADGCKSATKFKLLGKTVTGTAAEKDAPQTIPLDAKANRCYRVYAQSTDDIKDLDVVMKDSAQNVVGQDSTDDPSPVVNEDGAVCFSKDDKAAVVVTVDKGKGNWAVQIWSDGD